MMKTMNDIGLWTMQVGRNRYATLPGERTKAFGKGEGEMKKTLYDYCLETGREHLLAQWDAVGNLPMTTQTVSSGSRKYARWVCEKGHVWEAAIQNRTARETGCPYCAGRQALAGFNDLATLYPNLAAQWDTEKNGSITPDQVTPGNCQKVWWRCEEGHSWQALVKSRVSGCGCPVCAGRKVQPGVNDLATRYPLIAAQWDQEANGALLPNQILPGTHRKVWWRCEAGHSWKATVSSRTAGGCGCPVCDGKQVIPGVNDFASLHPELVAQWHPTKNLPLTPETVAVSSNRSAWWICPQGHEWKAAIARRSQANTGCPYCSNRRVLAGFNDLATVDPRIADQWDQELNGNLTPQMVTAGSAKRVWWRCDLGHTWKAKIYSRTSKQRAGCPVCAGRTKTRTRHAWTEIDVFQRGPNRDVRDWAALEKEWSNANSAPGGEVVR